MARISVTGGLGYVTGLDPVNSHPEPLDPQSDSSVTGQETGRSCCFFLPLEFYTVTVIDLTKLAGWSILSSRL